MRKKLICRSPEKARLHLSSRTLVSDLFMNFNKPTGKSEVIIMFIQGLKSGFFFASKKSSTAICFKHVMKCIQLNTKPWTTPATPQMNEDILTCVTG